MLSTHIVNQVAVLLKDDDVLVLQHGDAALVRLLNTGKLLATGQQQPLALLDLVSEFLQDGDNTQPVTVLLRRLYPFRLRLRLRLQQQQQQQTAED